MEVAAAAAMAIPFHALPRRELQALCKRNGVRANMTNAAMADALQSLPSVDGIDEIGTTLCLPTPGRSTMKSALKAAAAISEEEQQQQHGSPLPRGRRVSVKSPEAIRMDVEEGEDEMKRDLGKEIVRTPGVALRSTSRRARATPAPIPTPAASSVRATTRRTAAARKTEEATPTPGTLRRSQRTAARKASASVEEEVTTTKRTTRRSARSKVMIVLDQEVEDMAVALQEVKVQEEDPKDVASDEKCDETEEEEATKLLEEGNGKEEESEEGEEVVSSAAPTELAVVSVMSCDDPKEEKMAVTGEESAKTQEVEGVGKEQEPVSVVNSAPLPLMEDSPILGVLSKPEPVDPLSEKVEDASAGDGPGFGELSAAKEITGEIDRASDDKEVDADEVPEKNLPADVTDYKTSEEYDLNAGKEVSAVEMPQADLTSDESSEEEDLNEVKEGRGGHEGAADEMLQADLTESETSEEVDLDEESSEEDVIDESSEEDILDDESADEASEEYASSEETDGESDPSEVATDSEEEEAEMLPVTIEDALTAGINPVDDEEDDFSGDLPPEFDSAGNFSDAETESDTTLMTSSAARAAAVKSSDDDSVTEKLEASSEEEVSQQEVEASLNSIVKSLDEFTFTVEGTQQKDELTEEMKSSDDAEAVGAKELKKEKLTVEDLNAKSLRKLKTMYKDKLIAKAAAEGKRLALAELDDNAGVDC